MSVEDDLRTAAKILKWDDREWPDLAARLEALADRRAQEEAVLETSTALRMAEALRSGDEEDRFDEWCRAIDALKEPS